MHQLDMMSSGGPGHVVQTDESLAHPKRTWPPGSGCAPTLDSGGHWHHDEWCISGGCAASLWRCNTAAHHSAVGAARIHCLDGRVGSLSAADSPDRPGACHCESLYILLYGVNVQVTPCSHLEGVEATHGGNMYVCLSACLSISVWVCLCLVQQIADRPGTGVNTNAIENFWSEWVSSCLTAHQHNTGYSVPVMVECWNDLY